MAWPILEARAEIQKYFRLFVQIKTSKSALEIYWPSPTYVNSKSPFSTYFYFDAKITLHFNPVKGQLISKRLFGILNSSKKQTKKFDLTTKTPKVDLFSFVFWKNLMAPKRHFEINWPLVTSQSTWH